MSFVNIKTAILIVIILGLLLTIKNIVGSILTLRQNSRIVTTLSQQKQDEEQKKEFLKEQLYFINTPQFIENQAREKLGMVKPGEHIVLAPPPIAPTQKVVIVDNSPNWQKWLRLFF